ncbi:MAG TPA: hypothetical protein O0Y17_01160 [Methanocorpusculum sp.]|nr:hypothetical protein [Methanocorpusculum sp.]
MIAAICYLIAAICYLIAPPFLRGKNSIFEGVHAATLPAAALACCFSSAPLSLKRYTSLSEYEYTGVEPCRFIV